MDEVKKAEGEGSAGARPGGREPTDSKKLGAAVAAAIVFTEAVGDLHGMYTRDIE